jgi:hypothetical protein
VRDCETFPRIQTGYQRRFEEEVRGSDSYDVSTHSTRTTTTEDGFNCCKGVLLVPGVYSDSLPTYNQCKCDGHHYSNKSHVLYSAYTKMQSSPATRHGGAWGERRYSSCSFLTSALGGGEWSASRPGRALPPGKEPPVPIVQQARWAPELVWTQRLEEKYFALTGDRTPHTVR